MKIADGMRMGKFRWQIMILGMTGMLMMGLHPFYLSVTDVEFFPEESLVGVTIKVFTDDLEDVLIQRGAESLKLGASEEHEGADEYIARYLDQVIRWTINDQPTTFRLIGKEVELDVTYLYLEAVGIPELTDITVRHRLFLEELETQQNIVHLNCGESLSSSRLNQREDTATLSCE